MILELACKGFLSKIFKDNFFIEAKNQNLNIGKV